MSNQRTRKSGKGRRHLWAVPDPPAEVTANPHPTASHEPNDQELPEFVDSIYLALSEELGRMADDALAIECCTAGWLAMVSSVINSFVPDGDRDRALFDTLSTVVELARRDATPEALAVLRVLGVMSGTTVTAPASQAAAEHAASGIADRAWAATLLRPEPTSCLRYGDIDGSQETVLIGFRYGRKEHGIAVLIDHTLGGGIKDSWMTNEPDLDRRDILAGVEATPEMEVGDIDWIRTDQILSAALARPACGESPEQVRDAALYLPLLKRRLELIRELISDMPPPPNDAPTPPATTATKRPAAVAIKRPVAGAKTKASAHRARSTGPGLQLKVMIADSKPPIWRRLMVPELITLERLHHIIQTAFGWNDSHLHVFEISGKEYGPGGDWGAVLPERSRLNRLVEVGDRFVYVYDFGDDWRHVIQVEKRLPAGPDSFGPRCLTGRRAAPPDDCGGIWGYEDMVAGITDPTRSDPMHLDWFTETLGLADLTTYDPARFDAAEINAELSKLKR